LTALLTSVDRLLGLVAQFIGNLNQAMRHYEEALAFCRNAGYRPELAWTCHDYADCLLQRHSSTGSEPTDSADRERAASLLAESLSISRELGMRLLMERVLSRLDILGA
jgi:tetratricopeptide (TPR) repeat protein